MRLQGLNESRTLLLCQVAVLDSLVHRALDSVQHQGVQLRASNALRSGDLIQAHAIFQVRLQLIYAQVKTLRYLAGNVGQVLLQRVQRNASFKSESFTGASLV